MKRVKTIRELNVALTGSCGIGGGLMPRSELKELIAHKGGRIKGERARVTEETDILVRGNSPTWKHSTYERTDARAAEFIRNGAALSVILAPKGRCLVRNRLMSYTFRHDR